jgi:hypothetical protein
LDQNRHDPPHATKTRLNILRQVLSGEYDPTDKAVFFAELDEFETAAKMGSFDERGNKVRLARPSGLDTAADALLWLHSGQERYLSVYLATAKRNYWTDCK